MVLLNPLTWRAMKGSRLRWLLGLVLVIGVASEARYYLRQESLLSSEEELAVEVLEGSIEPVRRRFQQGKGRWRMVALASPMATTSVGAVASLFDDFLLLAPELPIEVTVVFFPGLPWDHRSKARIQPRFADDDRWRFYWDPEDKVASALLAGSRSQPSRIEGRYLVYPPEATWPRGGPTPERKLELSARGTNAARRGGAFAKELAELRDRIATGATEEDREGEP